MKKIKNIAAGIFIVCVVILAAVSIMGVWDVFDTDVITKSFETLGLLAGVAVVTMIAGHFIGTREELANSSLGQQIVEENYAIFTSIRRSTVAVLITSLVLLALFGVLSIWEVVASDVLHRSVSTIFIIVFAALIIVSTCLEREHRNLSSQKISGGLIVLVIIFGIFLFRWLFW